LSNNNVPKNKKKGIIQLIMLALFLTLLIIPFAFESREYAGVLSTVLLSVPLVLYVIYDIVSIVFYKISLKKLKSVKVAEGNQFMVSKLENIEKTYEADRNKLFRILNVAETQKWGFSFLPYVLCCISVFTGNYLLGVIWEFFGIMMFGGAIMRINVEDFKSTRPFQNDVLDRKEYPLLYGLAEKASEQNGCKGKIRLVSVPGFDVSIQVYRDGQYVYIGAGTLSIMNEQEMYAILLHEFSHSDLEKNYLNIKLRNHFLMINVARSDKAAGIFHFPYVIPDYLFVLNYAIFEISGSVYNETKTDEAMLKGGNPHAAASALIKLAHNQLADFETEVEDFESIYICEDSIKKLQTLVVSEFLKKENERSEFWNTLLEKEIQARNASHPITRTRLKTLSVDKFETENCDNDSEQYASEKKRILAKTDEDMYKSFSPHYKEAKAEVYDKPLENLTKWEEAGRPLDALTYRDIFNNLNSLGRRKEAFELCERAVNEFDEAAAAFGIYECGVRKLHAFDADGVDLIIKAADINDNYFDSGMDLIMHYARLTGNQQLLDEYRERVLEYGQKQKDYLNEIGVLKRGDKLEPEPLKEGQLEADIKAILEIGEGKIEQIYLVRKSQGPEFKSHYIIRLNKQVQDEDYRRIFNGIFNYLDTVSDWPYCLNVYNEVRKVGFEKVKGSCVYDKMKNK